MVSEREIHSQRRSCARRRAGRTIDRSHRGRPRTRVFAESGRIFFSASSPQHMRRSKLADWLAGAATLLAVASWGVLISLLGR